MGCILKSIYIYIQTHLSVAIQFFLLGSLKYNIHITIVPRNIEHFHHPKIVPPAGV